MFDELFENQGAVGLFISAFVSSTLAPGGSEAVLAYLIVDGQYNSFYLVSLATLGNTLGALTTYYLGYIASSKLQAKKSKKKHFDKAHELIQRYGSVALIFSWLPLIGDVLCLAAGWVKLNFLKSLCFITLGKFARYYLISLTLS